MKFNYEVKQELGILSQEKTITKELNLIAFNGGSVKFDIRTWNTKADGSKTMYKGITLTTEEAQELKKLLNNIDFDNLPKEGE